MIVVAAAVVSGSSMSAAHRLRPTSMSIWRRAIFVTLILLQCRKARKWRVGSYAALWISMSACIPTYMLASSLIGGGMNWWQAIMTISCQGEAYRSCERAGILSPTL
jgi:Permease for cytosine/purines, uracil, thiamine, allantoin